MTRAMAFLGNRTISAETQQVIADFALGAIPAGTPSGTASSYRAMHQNALRMLIATSPDLNASVYGASRLGLEQLGRYLDVAGTADNPLQGLSLGAQLAPALATASVPVAAIAKPSDYNVPEPWVGDPIKTPMLAAYGRMGQIAATCRSAVRRSTASAATTRTPTRPTGWPPTYCALLEQWMGVDAAQVIPGASAFTRPALVR